VATISNSAIIGFYNIFAQNALLLKETGTDLIENKNSLSASSKSSRTVSKV
jgi:hypothetical protein